MKKVISLFLTVFVLMIAGAGLSGDLSVYAVTSGDFEYTVLEDGTAEIIGYTGTDTALEIPSELDGYTVTSIGEAAFEDGSGLEEITIPAGVTSISSSAFEGCSSLSAIHVDENNTVYSSENGVLFNKDETEQILYSASTSQISVYAAASGDFEYDVLDDGTAEITGYTGSATVLEIPSEIDGYTVTSIGSKAFYNCSSLTEITIPDSVTSIGTYAFYGCTGLTNVTIGNSVTSIGNYTFYGCTSLTNVTMGNSVTSIGTYAFYSCRSLIEVTIPDGVTSIGYEAFEYCTSLTEITIPNGVTSIGYRTFSHCTSLTNVTIGSSVTSIGENAFSSCESLTEITIPSSVTSIGEGAFHWCSSLTAINVDENNTAYSSQDGVLFNKDKTELIQYPAGNERTSYTIPDSVTSIGEYAFYHCESLTEITIPDSVTSIGLQAFYGTAYYNDKSNWEDGVLYIGEYLIEADEDISGVYEIKQGTKLIADWAFEFCTGLTKITIPDSVMSIGDSAFEGCVSLIEITIPDGVTSIGNQIFYSCYSLTEIIIPDSVTSIGNYAFAVTGLTEITIPDSVTSIGSSAFYGCTSLANVTISNSVTSIGNHTFQYCSSLTEIIIPDGVTSIGDWAFFYCESLTEITIPDSVTSIGDYAFELCESLTEITIPDSVISIGDSVFAYCDNLTIYGYEGSYAQEYANENDIPFVALTSLADVTTGVVVMETADNVLPEGAEIVVEQISSSGNSIIYDITLLQNGEEIQPGGAVTVKISVPENMDETSCKVYRQEEDGTYTDMNAVYQNGYMVFTTDHFSEYVLTTENLSGSDVLLGDVTGDGIIDAADVVMVQRYDAGLITLSAEQLEAADVTGDGIVDAADVVMIQRYDAGLIASL